MIIGYISLVTIPQCFVFLLGLQLLHSGQISKWHFILALFSPVPFLVYWIYLISRKKSNISPISLNYNHKSPSTLKILDETQTSFKQNNISPWLCWMGFIEIRRLTLVLFEILLSNKIHDYFAKTMLICLSALIANVSVKPYKGAYLNIISAISLLSQLIVGMCSFAFAIKIESTSDMLQTMIPIYYVAQLFCMLMPLFLSLLCALPFAYKNIQKQRTHVSTPKGHVNHNDTKVTNV